MDAAAEQALANLARRALHGDLDALHSEIRALRYELVTVRSAVGLAPRQMGKSERQAEVLRLRSRGMSTASIAQALAVNRATVERDLRDLRAPCPPAVVGVDGIVRRRG